MIMRRVFQKRRRLLGVALSGIPWAAGSLLVSLPSMAGSQVQVAVKVPQRVVTLGGSVTEIVYALGLEHVLVADDASSLYPDAARRLPKVGYYRAVPLEGVLSMSPDLVLASANAGPPATLQRLSALGVRVESVPDEPAIESLYARIRTIAALFNEQARGEALVQAIIQALEQAVRIPGADAQAGAGALTRGQEGAGPVRAVVLLNRTGTYQAAGRDTAAHVVLGLAGLVNALDTWKGYKPLSLESLAALAPDVIVLTSASSDALGGVRVFRDLPAVQLTPAGRQGRVVVLDDLLILGLGPRVAQAVKALRQQVFV